MTNAAQSSPAFHRLPAAVALVLSLAATPAWGQQRGGARAADSAPVTPPAVAPQGAERVHAAGTLELHARPDSAAVGSVAPGTPARVLTRSGEWARVQVEAWVRADQLAPAGTEAEQVTAAELRADPEKHVGRIVDWRLQLISVQRADELRPEMPAGTPYLLMRGPLPEAGFVYVMVPREQAERFRAMPPLADVSLRVAIRAARTRYLATPVAELVSVLAAPGR